MISAFTSALESSCNGTSMGAAALAVASVGFAAGSKRSKPLLADSNQSWQQDATAAGCQTELTPRY